jgi:hypothetical protein
MAELSDDVRALLQARNMAHVATLMADEAPHVSPVWISLEGGRRRGIAPGTGSPTPTAPADATWPYPELM